MEYEGIEDMRETPIQLASPDLGSPKKVWKILCDNDDSLHRSAEMFARHPFINQRMRSVLLDWIMDVCHDQKLHRETYHLAIDYIDRFLLQSDEGFKPHQLQMIGSTALVIAMKMEEIYPPKVSTIADLTDGSCTEEQIRDMETCMLVRLDWHCTPVTAIHWLGLYLQLMSTSESTDANLNAHNLLLKKRPEFYNNHASTTSSRGRRSSAWSPSTHSPRSSNASSSGGRRSKGDRNLEAEDDEDEALDNLDDLEADKENHHQHHRHRRSDYEDEDLCNNCEEAMDAERSGGDGDSGSLLNSTALLDLSYLGGQTTTFNASDRHFYPDRRCTVSKLMRDEFVRLATVLDLVLLDARCLRFKYSELAAAVIWHSYEPENMVQGITGFRRDEIEDVLEFVKPFVMHCERMEPTGVLMPCHAEISADDAHNIQSYITDAIKHLDAISEETKKLSGVNGLHRARKRKLCNINQRT